MKIKQVGFFLALITFLSVALASLPSLALEKQQPENKAAVVNGFVITQHEFDREMKGTLRRFAGMGKTVQKDQMQILRKQVLENLINLEVLYQESQNNGIKISEGAVNIQLNAIKTKFQNEDDFEKALLNMDLSEADLRSQIRRELAVRQLIDQQFVEKTSVSEEEAKGYYQSHPDDFKKPEMVKAQHILIKIDPKADGSHKAEARKKIEDIQNKLKKGEDFASLAKEFSQCPSSASGGDLGYFTRKQMVKPFAEAAFALAPGEVSRVVETEFGYHLIKSVDKKPATSVAFEDVKEKLQEVLKHKKIGDQVGEYTESLKSKAKVERFIIEN